MNKLPSEIIPNILSRLPSRTISRCKCVCKPWNKLLSGQEFVKFHLSVSTPGLLVLHTDPKGEYLCKFFEDEDLFRRQEQGFRGEQAMRFDPRRFISSPADYLVEIKGSADGFLCLQYRSKTDDAICVCNPITREYTFLPRVARVKYAHFTHYGFGVSSKTGQYKVVYMFQKSVLPVWQCVRSDNYKCEFYDYLVYTLGAGSWRSLARNSPFELAHLSFGVFLNGNLHGLVRNSPESAISISCFDLEDESFKPFSPPPYPLRLIWFGSCDILGVLDDCLCVCDTSSLKGEGGIVFWTMKEYGVAESWTRQFVFMGTQVRSSSLFDVVHPIRGYENGDILFSWQNQMVFYYSNKTRTCHTVDVSALDLEAGGSINTILHNPSFLSLEGFDEESVASSRTCLVDLARSRLSFLSG